MYFIFRNISISLRRKMEIMAFLYKNGQKTTSSKSRLLEIHKVLKMLLVQGTPIKQHLGGIIVDFDYLLECSKNKKGPRFWQEFMEFLSM